jgi:Tfp pilus assembly protein PilN
METLFPVLIGVAALFYILMPIFSGATPHESQPQQETVLSNAQIELDEELGKIDIQEREELEAQIPKTVEREIISVESIIRSFRRQRRLDTALEAEVLIARARKKK